MTVDEGEVIVDEGESVVDESGKCFECRAHCIRKKIENQK